MRIFLLSGTQAHETRFARGVSDTLAKQLKRDHDVTRIQLPISQSLRKRKGLGEWKYPEDSEAVRAYEIAMDKGFDPENEEHLLLDLHENPVNWRNTYPEFHEFYAKHVEPSISESLKRGHLGTYFADVPNKKMLENIEKLKRKPIHRFAESSATSVRIEIPIIGIRNNEGVVVAHDEKTRALAGALTKKEAVTRIAELLKEALALRGI